MNKFEIVFLNYFELNVIGYAFSNSIKFKFIMGF